MNRKSRSILNEICNLVPQKDREDHIEAQAQHIIISAINLLESIEQNYTSEESDLLKKRFISSIKGSDPKRFTRMVNRIKSGTFDDEEYSDAD